MDIGQRIKSLREQKNLAQKELATILKIGNSTLSQYETGTRTPSDDMKIAIANYFGVSLDFLLGRNEKEPASISTDGLSERDIRLVKWFRSLPAEKQKAILTAQDAPQGLAD